MTITYDEITEVSTECIHCGLCVKECPFLQKYGTPGKICETFILQDTEKDHSVFSCNLCGLCEKVCPQNLNITGSFLSIRKGLQRTTANSDVHKCSSVIKAHMPLCRYQEVGSGNFFSLHTFPENCTTIFFPGCTLPAVKADTTLKTFSYLKGLMPGLGVSLDCCGKPSFDMGLQGTFEKTFLSLIERFRKYKIDTIITSCPSCLTTFQRFADGFTVKSVYEVLAQNPPTPNVESGEKVSIHDACVTRSNTLLQDSIRSLVSTSAAIHEMKHSKEHTLCCGEGAAVSAVAPENSSYWMKKRKEEAGNRCVVTYCAGCSNMLGKEMNTLHVLDLIFQPSIDLSGKERVTRFPFTYFNRLRVKRVLKKMFKK